MPVAHIQAHQLPSYANDRGYMTGSSSRSRSSYSSIEELLEADYEQIYSAHRSGEAAFDAAASWGLSREQESAEDDHGGSDMGEGRDTDTLKPDAGSLVPLSRANASCLDGSSGSWPKCAPTDAFRMCSY